MTHEAFEKLAKDLADQGKAVEAGWVALRAAWMHPDSPPDQVRDYRWAYMAGAQHVFSMMMNMLDEGEDPTTADLSRMSRMHDELEAFRLEMEMSLPVEGRA